MSFFNIVRVALICVVGSVANAHSTTMVDTHIGTVEVADQSTRSAQNATSDALLQVLVKMTGRSDIQDIDGVDNVLKSANRYLRSYRFSDESGELEYIAEFDRSALETVLVDSGLPLWGRRRPEALMWLVVEDNAGRRNVVPEDSQSTITRILKQSGQARGTPISLPLMDLDDNQAITLFDVWGQFPQRLTAASARYQTDIVLGARIYPNRKTQAPLNRQDNSGVKIDQKDTAPAFGAGDIDDVEQRLEPGADPISKRPVFTRDEFEAMGNKVEKGKFTLDYLISFASENITGSLYADDKAQLIARFIDLYADYLGQTYAIVPTGDGTALLTVQLSIGNLNSLSQYVAVQEYLSALSMTQKVTLIEQQGSVSTFAVSLFGNERDLMSILLLDNKLQPLRDAFGQPIDGLNFFWNR